MVFLVCLIGDIRNEEVKCYGIRKSILSNIEEFLRAIFLLQYTLVNKFERKLNYHSFFHKKETFVKLDSILRFIKLKA